MSNFIQQKSFQDDVLQTIRKKKLTRIGLGFVLDSLVQKKLADWERRNIPKIFEDTTVKRITRTYTSIYKSLQSIKNDTAAFKMHFNIFDKIGYVLNAFIQPNGGKYILGGVLLFNWSVVPKLNDAIASVGLFATIGAAALITFRALRSFDDACVEAFQKKRDSLTGDVISKSFQEKYEDLIKDFAHTFLKGELEEEIVNLQKNVIDMLGNLELFRNEKDTLQRLNDKLTKVREPLLCFETSNDGMI